MVAEQNAFVLFLLFLYDSDLLFEVVDGLPAALCRCSMPDMSLP
jgi:hypothetical protein